MAIINVKRMHSGDGFESDGQSIFLLESWSVLTDSLDTRGTPVAYAPGLPLDGAGFPGEPLFTLNNRRVRRSLGPNHIVELRYKLQTTPFGADANPLNRPARITGGGWVPVQEPFDIDLDGYPTVNTAGLPVDPNLIRDVYDYQFSIMKSVSSINVSSLHGYAGATNSDQYLGFAAGTLKIVDMRHSDQKVHGVGHAQVFYFEMEVTFRARVPLPQIPQPGMPKPHDIIGGPARAWRKRTKNVGFDELVEAGDPSSSGSDDKHEALEDVNGQPLATPRSLDGAGRARPKRAVPPMFFLEFRDAPIQQFALLNLLP